MTPGIWGGNSPAWAGLYIWTPLSAGIQSWGLRKIMEGGGTDHEELQSGKAVGGINEAISQKCAQQPCAKRADEKRHQPGKGWRCRGVAATAFCWVPGLCFLPCKAERYSSPACPRCTNVCGLWGWLTAKASSLQAVVVITAKEHRTVLSQWRVPSTRRRMWQAVAQMEWSPGHWQIQGGEWLPMQNPGTRLENEMSYKNSGLEQMWVDTITVPWKF